MDRLLWPLQRLDVSYFSPSFMKIPPSPKENSPQLPSVLEARILMLSEQYKQLLTLLWLSLPVSNSGYSVSREWSRRMGWDIQLLILWRPHLVLFSTFLSWIVTRAATDWLIPNKQVHEPQVPHCAPFMSVKTRPPPVYSSRSKQRPERLRVIKVSAMADLCCQDICHGSPMPALPCGGRGTTCLLLHLSKHNWGS